jgi:hypothetical protein
MPQDRWLGAIKRLLNAESYFRAREEAEPQENSAHPSSEEHSEPGPPP